MVRLALGLALAVLAATPSPVQAEPWQLESSEVQTISASNGKAYRMMTAWPAGDCPEDGWPVLWVLDGEDNFAVAAVTARRLAEAGKRTGVAPGVVVGVDSGPLPQRVYDYTPNVPGYAIAPGMPAAGLETGGADVFLDIVEQELLPQINGRCPIDLDRHTLAGHSFGGLLALHALSTGRSFAAYAAISPSLWYGGGTIVNARAGDARLLLADGSAEPQLGENTSAKALAERWRSSDTKVKYFPLEGHGHGTTMLAAMGQIIEIAFGSES